MNRLAIALLLSTAACGVPRSEVVAHCDVPQFGRVNFEFMPNCETVQANFETARTAFDKHGIIAADDFYASLRGVPIHVRKYISWDAHSGYYDILGGVELGHLMNELGHELLHVFDANHFGILSGSHPGWDKNGYLDAASECRTTSSAPHDGMDSVSAEKAGVYWTPVPGND